MSVKQLLITAVFVGIVGMPRGAGAPHVSLIVPGRSVGGIVLGANFAAFEKSFPKHPDTDTDYPDNGCGDRVYQWVDLERHASGLFVYLRNNKIKQLSVQTTRFALADGLTINGTQAAAQKALPAGREYRLLHSGMAAVGGHDLLYRVDDSRGLAIGLYWNESAGKWLVRSIDIFDAGTPYQPEGCILPPQEWREVEK